MADTTYSFPYNYHMGIKITRTTKNGNEVTALPDPSEWSYQVGDLDTSGRRDATGLLHRKRVATKINYEFQWNGIEWAMLQTIVNAIQDAKFKLTAPNPITFNTTYTGDYYVGDRTGKAKYFLPGQGASSKFPRAPGGKPEIATYTLKLKFIEY